MVCVTVALLDVDSAAYLVDLLVGDSVVRLAVCSVLTKAASLVGLTVDKTVENSERWTAARKVTTKAEWRVGCLVVYSVVKMVALMVVWRVGYLGMTKAG